VFPERSHYLGHAIRRLSYGLCLAAADKPFSNETVILGSSDLGVSRTDIKILATKMHDGLSAGFMLRQLGDSNFGHNATSIRFSPYVRRIQGIQAALPDTGRYA
jgi:hypothetical protein